MNFSVMNSALQEHLLGKLITLLVDPIDTVILLGDGTDVLESHFSRWHVVTDSSEATPEAVLKKASLEDFSRALVVLFCSEDVNSPWWSRWADFTGAGGIYVINGYPLNSPDASKVLFWAAESGFIPTAEGFYVKEDESAQKLFTQIHFLQHDYHLRHPVESDLDALVALENVSWGAIGVSSEVISSRITQHPEDQLVLEQSGEVIGAMYSQPINDAKDLLSQQSQSVHRLYDPQGQVMQLIAVNVFPEIQAKGLGIDLLEFMLQWRTLQGWHEVAAVTRWGDYEAHHNLTPDAYLSLINKDGDHVDSIVHMHEAHGAEIKGLIAQYRPLDEVNKGFGVLIAYDLSTRHATKAARRALKIQTATDFIATADAAAIKAAVIHDILEFLPEKSLSLFTEQAPLMGLGFTSLKLMQLRDTLSIHFNEPLHATFLFRYGTAQLISDYFIERQVHQYRDWLYNVEWVELAQPLLPSTRSSTKGVWVVFVDESGFAQPLIAKLEAYGFECVIVKAGATFETTSHDKFIIRANELDDYTLLFQSEAFAHGLAGVVYLWGLFTALPQEPSLALLNTLHAQSCTGLLNLVKTLNAYSTQMLPHLFVASWSISDEGNAMSIAQWPMTGFSKAIAMEHPEFKVRQVFFDQEESMLHSVDNLFSELFASDYEEQIVWRGEKRLGPRVIRVELPTVSAPVFEENATYLITGGLGGLGLGLAKWYAARGARHLVLMDANTITPEAGLIINELTDSGVAIRFYASFNMVDTEAMAQAISDMDQTLPPLKGVMHAATLIDDDMVIDLTWSRFQSVFDVMVSSAWNLHLLTKNKPLSHFVLCSSIGSTMGPSWRANRSAANAFLDALAHYRRTQGLPALAINWGPWDYEGMIVKHVVEINIPDGLKLLSMAEGIDVLDRVINVPIPQVVAAPIDWRLLMRRFEDEKPLFTNMAREIGLRKSEIITRFMASPVHERLATIEQYARMIVRRVLLLRPTAPMDNDALFSLIGIDKRTLMDIRNQMQFDLGDEMELPFNLFVENQSIRLLSKALEPLFAANVQKEQAAHDSKGQAPLTGINEPIAIIGMSCRFPGGANSPEQFWNNLINGIDAITEVPANRWDIDAYYDADKDAPGKMYTRFGGFIDHVDLFDPLFFGISPREAEDMDPQQRISLEVTWEALEHAGIAAHTLKGSNTGVFMGICFNDYGQLIRQSSDVSAVDNYYSTGNHYSVAAGRISYILGLEGPAMAIDTACSSSLVSIDNAVKHLHLGQCNLAIAGGVNLILAPESTINFCKSGMLAEDGRCKTFDEKANGYVRGEGCGMLILKRLSDAQKDNDRILAVIHATSINQDGASTGLTVPNQKAQEQVIKAALTEAHLKSSDIHYVEAHGTGTSLGDPIEVRAIAATYGANRDPENALILGSAKTNIGHTEAASGVAGLIKCVLALQHQELPRHLHFHRLNPYIDINPEQIKIAQTALPWMPGETARYAAVSSFGFSGTNSHAIIGEAPKIEASSPAAPPYILPLSAKTTKALQHQVQQLKAFLETHSEVNLSDVAYTLQTGREPFQYREALIGNSLEELLQGRGTLPEAEQTLVNQWLSGESVTWVPPKSDEVRHKIALPTYPFQRERYWAKVAIKSKLRNQESIASQHALLSEHHALPTGALLVKGSVDVHSEPLFQEHCVYEQMIFPAAGFIDAVVSAAALGQYFNGQAIELSHLNIQAPLLLSSHHDSTIAVLFTPTDSSELVSVRLDSQRYSQGKPVWMTHLNATASVIQKTDRVPVNLTSIQQACPKRIEASDYYRSSREAGLDYGLCFQGLKRIYLGTQQGLGHIDVSTQVTLHQDVSMHRYLAHPTIVDSCLQLVAAIRMNESDAEGIYLPIGFESVILYSELPETLDVHAVLRPSLSPDLLQADIRLYGDGGVILAELLGYSAKSVQRAAFNTLLAKTNVTEDMYYELQWIPQPIKPMAQRLNQNWLLMTECPELEAYLKQSGVTFERLVSDLPESHYDVIVYAGDMNERLLNLVQGIMVPTRLVVLKSADAMQQGTLGGFLRTVPNEYPQIDVTLIEYEQINQVFQVLDNDEHEPHIRFKEGQAMVPRLSRMDVSGLKVRDSLFQKQATYLITAGLSALGLELAQWMVQQGASSLVLTKRNPPTPAQQQILDSLSAFGVTLTVVTADVTQYDEMQQIVTMIQATLPPLKGIFHTAGIVDDGVIAHQTWERFERVFAPKVQGVMHLHELSKELALDYFVVYSSIVSVLGLAGQANYAAANSFMDDLIAYRRRLGLVGLSINWGPWGEVGMAMRQQMSIPGMHNLTIKQGMDALHHLLQTDLAQAIVSPMEWSLFLGRYKTIPTLMSHFIPSKTEPSRLEKVVYNLHEALENAAPHERDTVLEQYLVRIIKSVLKLRDNQSIDTSKGFFEMGMDSLMAVDLKNQLQADLGNEMQLPTTLVFAYSNVQALVLYFKEQVYGELCGDHVQNPIEDPDGQPDGSSELQQIKEKIEHLSSDDLLNELSDLKSYRKEPIAIIGMACRFPGNVSTPEDYWNLLRSGTDAITQVPASRWDLSEYYDADKNAPGKMYTTQGGFLEQPIDLFDTDFFNISPREACDMDPQQRLLLEACYEALEDACIPISALKGTDTGMYMGIMYNDYFRLLDQTVNKNDITAYYDSGNLFSATVGRLSYFLGINGPCIPIDTACSSSLVAIELACQSLYLKQSKIALAGGVNLTLKPESMVMECKAGMLADDGRCKTFDAQADGFSHSEGCGVIVLKRLSDAQKDNDRILAVIRGGAINHGGASSGLTVPNQLAQEALLRQALESAALKPEDIDYIEAHGTGTSLGDPIEVAGIASVYGKNRSTDNALIIGSVKTNIGHTESAAGIAGLMKVVLSLQNNEIPPHLHLTQLNPMIDMDCIPAKIPMDLMPWNRTDRIRRAGISSFGFSGINAHIIVEEAPKNPAVVSEDVRLQVVTLSAKTESALDALITSYQHFLKTTSSSFADLCYSTNTGREHQHHRIAVIANSVEELQAKLAQRDWFKDEALETKPYAPSDGDWVGVVHELAEAYVKGARIDWDKVHAPFIRTKVSLPTYPFQRQRYWSAAAKPTVGRRLISVHPLLGVPFELADGVTAYSIEGDAIQFHSAACIIELFSVAQQRRMGLNNSRLTHIHLSSFDKHEMRSVSVQTLIKDAGVGSFLIQTYYRPVLKDGHDETWQLLASSDGVKGVPLIDKEMEHYILPSEGLLNLGMDDFYTLLDRHAVNSTDSYARLNRVFIDDDFIYAEIETQLRVKGYSVHPQILQAFFDLIYLSIPVTEASKSSENQVHLVSCDELITLGRIAYVAKAKFNFKGLGESGLYCADVFIYDEDENLALMIKGLGFRLINEMGTD